MKKHNFSAGPAALPQVVIDETIKAMQNFAGTGLSLACVSHRGKEFDAVNAETQQLFKELLNIPAGYEVLFLGGGASLQFCMLPQNLLNKKAVFLNTGVWSTKAIKEAKLFGEVIEIKGESFMSIPKGFTIDETADYFHITTNNTIYGTQLHADFDTKIPVIADMSSDIMSRRIDVSKYGVIYGGAQKNLAPAGVTFVIIKTELLGKVDRAIPSYLDYKNHIKESSMYNTPPVIPIYAMLQNLKWIKELGGVDVMEQRAKEKAEILYAALDSSRLFRPTVIGEDRSLMNICWVMKDEYKELEKEFLDFAKSKGMEGLKGHRLVGGFRASVYNAVEKESVIALVDAIKEFEAKH